MEEEEEVGDGSVSFEMNVDMGLCCCCCGCGTGGGDDDVWDCSAWTAPKGGGNDEIVDSAEEDVAVGDDADDGPCWILFKLGVGDDGVPAPSGDSLSAFCISFAGCDGAGVVEAAVRAVVVVAEVGGGVGFCCSIPISCDGCG